MDDWFDACVDRADGYWQDLEVTHKHPVIKRAKVYTCEDCYAITHKPTSDFEGAGNDISIGELTVKVHKITSTFIDIS